MEDNDSSKKCEICGRSIKSGYKYCWEHRHTAQAEKNRILRKEDELIEEANHIYIENYVKRELELHDNFKKGDVARLWKSRKRVEEEAREKALDYIDKKAPRYINRIKEIISSLRNEEKEEKDFKRDILSNPLG